MRTVRSALLAALVMGCGGGSTTDAPDASSSKPLTSTTLSIARDLARPERAVAEVLRGRIALRSESTGLGVLPTTSGDLALHVATKASDPTRIGTDDDHSLLLSVEGASASAVEADDGSAIHRDVFPGTDAIWATTEARAELLFLLRDSSAPTQFRLHLDRGAGLVDAFAERGGYSFRDANGKVRLHIPTPVALDARGVSRTAEMKLADDGHTLTITLDDTGLEHPILLDPAVLQGRWVKIGDRLARTRATLSFDPVRKKLLGYGGYQRTPTSPSNPGDVSKDLFEYTSPGGTFGALASGPYGFTSAMIGPPSSSGPQNYGYVGAFDSTRGKLVAVGARQYDCSAGCVSFDRMEVWEWDSATNVWAQRCTASACATTAPGTSQEKLEAIYDETRKATVVCNNSFGSACSTWNGATGTWTALVAPPVQLSRGWYDPSYGAATFLGSDGTYSWTGAGWTKRTTSFVYPLAVSYDTLRKRAIALVGNGFSSDTYEWNGTSGAWTLVVPAADTSPPYNKASIAMGYDRINGRTVAWGGGDGQAGIYLTDFIATVFEYQAYGNACAGDVDCNGGSCRDGFCCDTKCGTCQRCDGPGNGGICATFAGATFGGTEHDTCTGTKACDPLGACKLKNGQTCSAGSECASGACVDGYCCGSACNKACEVCNVTPGTCTPSPKGSGGRTSCGVGSCDGVQRVCSTTCTTDADCSASGFCSAGTCVATSAQGAACTRDRQCTTGSCRDGFCCNSGCSGACETCAKVKGASADGTCTPLPASTKPAACGGYACTGTSGACAAACTTDAGCATGFYCDGSFCQKTRAQGDGCARTGQCTSGLTCADGVCCNSACDGLCQACSVANKESGDAPGVCGPAKIGTDPGDRCPKEDSATCGKSGVCGAGGTCALWPKGSACGSGISCDGGSAKGRTCDGLGSCVTDSAGTSCKPGTCSTTLGCTFACAADTECDAKGFCDSGTCKTRAPAGRTCTADNQCEAGFCVDGVCCSTACKGVCEACNGGGTEGTCTAVTGVPREGHGTCPSASTDDACTAAACDGSDREACKAFAGPEVTCRAASCTQALETLTTKCDGSGKCPASPTRSCVPFACGGTRCKSTCATNDDCALGNRCDVTTGVCVSNGTCDGNHTIVGADGTKTECAPYRCGDTGCKNTCVTSDECSAPAICDGSKCVLPAAAAEDSGGCSASPRSRGGSLLGGAFVMTMTMMIGARRRRLGTRKGAR